MGQNLEPAAVAVEAAKSGYYRNACSSQPRRRIELGT
jgi:hypothetical protein